MGLGSFMRVRMYMLLGFAALMTDLGSIVYKVLRHMERGARMTAVGSMVLMIGVAMPKGSAEPNSASRMRNRDRARAAPRAPRAVR